MTKSILSNEKKCYVCGTEMNLHRHHIFEGRGRREISEKEGCWVYLCALHHNMSFVGVHFNGILDLELKQKCQRAWEDRGGTREEFINRFGRNYLDQG